MQSVTQLEADLKALGVTAGDVLFVHSSFKSLGEVQGGAGGVVDALTQAVGPTGTLLMPSFNLVAHDKRADTWQIDSTPSTVGYLTEYFRTMPRVERWDHYSHSVAAMGAAAHDYVKDGCVDEGSQEGMCSPWDKLPWGRTYGNGSPFAKAYERDGKLLMLGVDYHSSTFVHFVEVVYWNQRLASDAEAKYFWLNRDALGAWWDAQGRHSRGKVGQADCRLFSIREYVDALLDVVSRDPLPWRKVD